LSAQINIFSEIGKLNKVMLHRPGIELEGLIPSNMERLLFDDIPNLKIAQKEHDFFADILRQNDVEVLELEDLLVQAVSDETIKKQFLNEFLTESGILTSYLKESVTEYLISKSPKEMIENIFAGIKKKELIIKNPSTSVKLTSDNSFFYTDPIAGAYFTRDPATCIGNGISINFMTSNARKRESLLLKYIYLYNKTIKNDKTPLWYSNNGPYNIEGGDILILSKKIIAIGCSQRTTIEGIKTLAQKLLKEQNCLEKILVFEIPKCRAFMHLDTVFTMVDYGKFTIHSEIEGSLNIYEIEMDKSKNLVFNNVSTSLKNILSKSLKCDDIEFIKCGGGDELAGPREQWNDGSNTLAIAPGVVITYNRNYVTNELLDKSGVKVLEMPSSELSRGRGGPRCMSMPINRDNIDV